MQKFRGVKDHINLVKKAFDDPDPAHGLFKKQQLQPERAQDIQNIWKLLRFLRGHSCTTFSIQTPSDLINIRTNLEACDSVVGKSRDEQAVYTLYKRSNAAILEAARREIEADLGVGIRNGKPVDLLIAKMYPYVDPKKPTALKAVRRKVNRWLRYGKPLVDVSARNPALLIVPLMRLSQEE